VLFGMSEVGVGFLFPTSYRTFYCVAYFQGSLRLCVESFFAISKDGFTPAELTSMKDSIAFGVPVCVHVDYVAQKQVWHTLCRTKYLNGQMLLGRDLVPVQVPSTLPVHAKAYQAYRSSIPNIVATIERKEKTTTPPFATHVCSQARISLTGRARS
jgi:hypothetical protein